MKFFLGMIILFFVSTNLNAQIIDVGNKVLVKGVVTDIYTGAPVGSNIEFKDSEGKKIKIFSNSKTGMYEQLLAAGEYEVFFQNWNVARSFDKISVKKYDKYGEQVFNFKVKYMQAGSLYDSVATFPKGSETINHDFTKYLEDLKVQMKFNRGVDFDIYVSSADITPQAPAVKQEAPKEKGKSKNKAKQAVKTAEPLKANLSPETIKNLVDKRIEALKALIKDWGSMGARLNFKPDYLQSETPSGNNLVIKVKKVEDIFK